MSSQPSSGVILRTASGIVVGYASGRSILLSTSHFVQPTPGQTISTNNCCELTWQCNSDQDWAKGFESMQKQNHRCALPGLISIVGAPVFVDHYERALDLLKNKAPQLYDYVLNGLDKIEGLSYREWSNVSPGLRIFFVAWRDGRPAHVGRGAILQEAAVLVHEACHVHRYDAGLVPGELVGERACLTEQIAALEVMSPGDPSLPGMRHTLANIDKIEYQWWHH